MAGRVEDQAFVTLATNDPYCYGALVLGQSLRDHGTTRQLAILVTPQVSQPMRQQLSQVYDEVRQVNPLDSHDEAHLALLTRPELGITFTKIRCWKEFTQYNKCVFLDADALVLQNVDELFEREELSAVPDVGWPDCFNSGVFVFKPSEETYNSLLQCAVTQGSFDGGDQGLLNTFFNSWRTDDIKKHLSFVYNMTSNISYTYKPALLKFGQNIKIVHFIGTAKPWRYTYNTVTGQVSPPDDVGYGNGHQLSFVEAWWSIFMTSIKPRIEQAQARHELTSSLTQSHETAPEPSNVQTNNTTPTSSYHTGSQFTNVHTPPSTNFPSVNFGLTQPSSQQAEEASESKPSTNINLQGVDLASQMGCLKLSDGGAAGFSVNPPGSPRTRQHLWEQGQVDYMGQDKFDNIDQFIQDKINGKDKEKEKDGKEKEKVGKDKK